MLREAGREADALALLESALQRQPDNLELLYETALLAERQGKPEVLEKRLKRLLELKPDHAHALNALGYSWADRNIHLAEAEALLVKAVQLAPEDRSSWTAWAGCSSVRASSTRRCRHLSAPMRSRPIRKLPPHLGEVLWRLERRDEARRLLKEAASRNPDSDVLAAVIKKLQP